VSGIKLTYFERSIVFAIDRLSLADAARRNAAAAERKWPRAEAAMTVPIQITHTLDRLSVRLGLLPNERLQAAVRALNRTATTVRAEAARELQKSYRGLRIAAIKKRIRFTRATRLSPSVAVIFSGKRIPLYGNFGMRSAGKWGVRFSGLPWRIETVSGEAVSPDMLERAFRQRSTRTGRADVFSRHTAQAPVLRALLAPGIARALAEAVSAPRSCAWRAPASRSCSSRKRSSGSPRGSAWPRSTSPKSGSS
jgi:hypothetical protein